MNEVVIGAPYSVSQELIDHFKVNVVLHGKTVLINDEEDLDPYRVSERSET